MSEQVLTPERLRELAEIAEAEAEMRHGRLMLELIDHIDAQAAEIERLRRERQTLLSLLRQVDVVMDGAAMMGVGSIMTPRYREDWAVVHTRVREHLALLDGEKGGGEA